MKTTDRDRIKQQGWETIGDPEDKKHLETVLQEQGTKAVQKILKRDYPTNGIQILNGLLVQEENGEEFYWNGKPEQLKDPEQQETPDTNPAGAPFHPMEGPPQNFTQDELEDFKGAKSASTNRMIGHDDEDDFEWPANNQLGGDGHAMKYGLEK